MMKKAMLSISLVFLLCGPALADAPFGSIKAVKSMPINGVKVIESDKGVFFVSENGRFAWKGPVFDMWNNREVKGTEDVDAVVNNINLKKIGIDPAQLSTLTIGQGDKDEVLFVSSDCPHCQDLLKQAVKLVQQYRFHVVLLPMGQKSMEHTRKLLCAKDKDAAINALLNSNYDSLEPGNCEVPSLQRTLVVARILGIRSVPYIVRHDGRVKMKGIKDLAGWLAESDQAKTKEKREAKEK